MKFCPVVPEICRGQVHGSRKERKKERNNNNKKRPALGYMLWSTHCSPFIDLRMKNFNKSEFALIL
jgi:hypothetical protein